MDSSDGVSANPQRGPFIGRPMPRFEDMRLVRGGVASAVAGAGAEAASIRSALPPRPARMRSKRAR